MHRLSGQPAIKEKIVLWPWGVCELIEDSKLAHVDGKQMGELSEGRLTVSVSDS